MKKRGDVSLRFLLELVASFLVAYMAVSVSVSYTQGTIFEKLHIAKDLAMQINALSSLPGDGYIINTKLYGYSLHFSDNKVEVFEDSADLSKGVYYFVKIGSNRLDSRFSKPKQVVISKINNEIIITEEIPVLK
ncbi:hypothetical protein J4458_01140 [Candidatus Woesearchaeota archaeon]|nr:hypothetical protein [Candidatus Woesearchaeota archaeon]